MRVRPTSRRWLLDGLLAALVLTLGLLEVYSDQVTGPRWAALAAVAALAGAALLRRTQLWVALVVAFSTIVLSYAAGVAQDNFLASVVAALAIMATAGYAMELRASLLALVYGYVSVAVTNERAPANYAWLALVLGGAWGAGRALRSRRLLIDDLQATTRQLERSREELAERAVAQERLRIAQDIHDVVAHSVTVMLVQAAAAERTLHRSASEAGEVMQAVQESGRQALAQLRELLGVLRPEADPSASTGRLSPQPGLADVDPLVIQFRDAGLAVDYQPTDGRVPMAPSVELAAYRVAQESLTNVLKHSAARQATLRLLHRDGSLVVDVTDGGPGRAAGEELGGGHGLVGMRERVRACGGDLDAGPSPEGGFRVTARLPLGFSG